MIARGTAHDLLATANSPATASIDVGNSNYVTKQADQAGPTISDAGGNQSGAPLFADAANGNYHQVAGSPTIDAGTDYADMSTIDYDGDPRKVGAAADIGADEYVGGPADPGGGGDPGGGSPGGGGDPGGGGIPIDTIMPALSGIGIAPHAFRAAASGPSAAARTGATISFKLSEIATVTFRVERRVAGRKARGRCVKPTRRNGHGKRCKRFVRVKGSFARAGLAGDNAFTFRGRIGGKRLKPGNYRLVGIPVDLVGNRGSARRSGFKIVR